MDKQQLINELVKFKERLNQDVSSAYVHKGAEFGRERFSAWERAIYKFLDKNLSVYKKKLYIKLNPTAYVGFHDPMKQFRVYKYDPSVSFIESLILDIQNDEIEENVDPNEDQKNLKVNRSKLLNKTFIVHGHDDATKERTARYLEKLGFEAVILHEQASGGKTIIEKLEHFTDVGFGIVLYTADDEGSVKDKKDYKPRARQNVVFEHGLLIGKLGRGKVFPLVTDYSVELPGDISGMVYLSDTNWELQLAKEIRELGYQIDMNKVV